MALRRRDDAELRRVYRSHVDAVFAFLAYSVPQATAEDLTSATFERVIKAWRSYDPAKASERTWVLTIARNILIDHYRRERIRRATSLDAHPELAESRSTGEDEFERILSDDALRAWLAPLSEREREVVALRYAADMPATEIARITGLSPANVHQIASRSLRRLRALAEEQGRLSGSA